MYLLQHVDKSVGIHIQDLYRYLLRPLDKIVGIHISDMIFLRFKAEFHYPECPMPLNFITIRFFCKVRVRVWFRIL